MEAVFQQVLTMSLSAGLLTAVVVGLRFAFRKSPKWVHCALWALVGLRLVLPSLPQSELSMVPQGFSQPDVIAEFVEEIPGPVPRESVPASLPPASYETLPADPGPAYDPAPVGSSIGWTSLLARVWLAGIGVMGAYGLLSYLRIRRRVAASVELGRRVFLCDYIDTPFLLGLVKPRIYLPSFLDSNTAGYVLAHERAHLRRRDHWWKPLGFALLSVHWFNPMIWAAYILLCRDIELACDEAVIRTMDETQKQGYSGALLQCSIPRHLISICPLAFGEVGVKERIRWVLRYRKPALWLSLAATAAVAAAAVCFLTNPAETDVTFYTTACYSVQQDQLELTEYDGEFRVTWQGRYSGGVLQNYTESVYQKIDDSQLRTVKLISCPGGSILSYPELQIDVPPGESATLVFRETLDKDGKITESTCNYAGTLYQRLPVYDGQGRLISQQEDQGESSRITTYTYDRQGNLLSKQVQWKPAAPDAMEYEETFRYDDRGNLVKSQSYVNGALSTQDVYVWDEENRLASQVKTLSGRADYLCSYTYDETGLIQTCDVRRPGEEVHRQIVTTFDKFGNKLAEVYRENGMELWYYYNYIGSDGTKSLGIPKDIYTPGDAVTAHPAPVQQVEQPIRLTAQGVHSTGCTLVLQVAPVAYEGSFSKGHPFTLERKTQEGWTSLNINSQAVQWNPQPLEDMPLSGGYYTAVWDVSWAGLYGILPPGTYRLSTYLSDQPAHACSTEFQVPASDDDGECIQQCMQALNRLVTEEEYHVEILSDDGTREVHAKSDSTYLYTVGQADSLLPASGELRHQGANYLKIMGCWAIHEEAASKNLTQWFERFVFEPAALSLLPGSTDREISFAVAPRPGREEAQNNHKITFLLDSSGSLTQIREEGIYTGDTQTPYSHTLTVLSTGSDSDQPARNPNLEQCNSFFWENDKLDTVGGRYFPDRTYVNDTPVRLDTVLDVYCRAKRELPGDASVRYGMVARDKQAGMWRVEFRYTDGLGGYVYLDEDGVTRLVKLSYPADEHPEQVEAALVKCRAVLYELQQTPCYGVETYFDSSETTGTITSWVYGEDWVESVNIPGNGPGTVRMCIQGQLSGKAHSELPFPQQFRGSQGQFVPWLAACRWEDYDVTLLSDQGNRIQIAMEPKTADAQACQVLFRFNSSDDFESAMVYFSDGSQTNYLLSAQPDTVSQQILTYSMADD